MTTSERRPDIDWLRVLATYLLFVFHAAKVYDVSPFYHVKSSELSPALDLFTGFIHLWHMPLFFVLAGWSAWDSLGKRSVGRFALERVQKLLIPLLFGMAVFGPILRWAELRTGQMILVGGEHLAAQPELALLDYVPTYFASTAHLTWGHLWFLAYLFTFTLLYLPLLALARRAAQRIRALSVGAGLVYLPIVPLALVQLTLRERWPGMQNLIDDWANFAYYSLCFLLGFALAAAPRFEQACLEQWRRAGMLALGAVAVLLILRPLRHAGIAPVTFSLHTLSAVAGWCTVVALLGAARELPSVRDPAPAWLVASAFPVYVLHQVGVVLAALFVIELPLPIVAKLPLTIALAVAGTLAAYFALHALAPAPLRWGLAGDPRAAPAAARSAPGPSAREPIGRASKQHYSGTCVSVMVIP
jgi:peptidoglycan/LPS O-acetylase OafA/YrhL